MPPMRHELTVVATEWLTSHLVRVVAEGATVAQFPDGGFTDAYVKVLFDPPPGQERPVMRTYTLRWVDRAARRLAIDFVTHGDAGVAAPWAARAVPGDRLTVSGPGGAYAPDPAASWHVFAGDLSALPAIAAALEVMPGAARGVVHLEIADPADIVELKCPEQVTVNWLVNPDPSDAGFLARSVDSGPWPVDGVQVFAHGERESVKAVRAVLRDRGVPRDAISISGYWARGRTEDVFQAEKREPVGQID